MNLCEISSDPSAENDYGNESITSLEEATDLIKTHCKQFLNVAKISRLVLYRGIGQPKRRVDVGFVGNPPAARPTKSSSSYMQKYIDKALSERGFKSFRGNSIFCTARSGFAQEFGSLYLIFPFDDYSFMWSPTHDDIVLPEVFGMDKGLAKDTQHNPLLSVILPYLKPIRNADITYEINTLINSLKNMNDLNWTLLDPWDPTAQPKYKQELITDKEVLDMFRKIISLYKQQINVNEVENVFTPNQWKHIRNIIDSKVKVSKDPATIIDGIIKQYDFQNTNLGVAMKSGHEIAIHSKYIAIQIDDALYESLFLHELGLLNINNFAYKYH